MVTFDDLPKVSQTRATIDLLKDTSGDRLISRFGPVNWPPRSCDLTPLDYFLWGYVKSLVYAVKPQTLDHLKDNIRRVIADIRPQMLEKVIENWTSRLDYIRASRGNHMPEIILKIRNLPLTRHIPRGTRINKSHNIAPIPLLDFHHNSYHHKWDKCRINVFPGTCCCLAFCTNTFFTTSVGNSTSSKPDLLHLSALLQHQLSCNISSLATSALLQHQLSCNISSLATSALLQHQLSCNISSLAISALLQYQLSCNISSLATSALLQRQLSSTTFSSCFSFRIGLSSSKNYAADCENSVFTVFKIWAFICGHLDNVQSSIPYLVVFDLGDGKWGVSRSAERYDGD
ncbi:uncharacterized protein TNCV_5090701 [Trichonephila clavipes]|nr:uncharacterized protein TNCV_5090701 [Trichonephila clavipes]